MNYKQPEQPSLISRIKLLADRNISFVILVTCFTSMACIGLHSYIAQIQVGTPNSLTLTLFIWGLGGFIGSSFVGFVVDKLKNPQLVMSIIIVSLILNFTILPVFKNITYLGLIPIFIWGALGWATTTPQQYILFDLKKDQGTILAGLNASAIGLGGAVGTALGGVLVVLGIGESRLPLLSAVLLIFALCFQLTLNKNINRETPS